MDFEAIIREYGVRIRPPSSDDVAWCARVQLPPMLAKLEIDVTLRRTSDGCERVIKDDVGFTIDGPDDGEDALDGAIYQWTEGNYGCDCNRRLFFQRVADEDETDHECGHGEFTITAPRWLADLDNRARR